MMPSLQRRARLVRPRSVEKQRDAIGMPLRSARTTSERCDWSWPGTLKKPSQRERARFPAGGIACTEPAANGCALEWQPQKCGTNERPTDTSPHRKSPPICIYPIAGRGGMVEAVLRQARHNPPKTRRDGLWRVARAEQASRTEQLVADEKGGWSHKSQDRGGGGHQGAGQINHGRLNAGLAVGTSGGLRRGLVVMEQASKERENEDRHNGQSLAWEPLPDAPCWMLYLHRAEPRKPQHASIVHPERRCSKQSYERD